MPDVTVPTTVRFTPRERAVIANAATKCDATFSGFVRAASLAAARADASALSPWRDVEFKADAQ